MSEARGDNFKYNDWGEWKKPSWEKPATKALDTKKLEQDNIKRTLDEANEKFKLNGISLSLNENSWELIFQKWKDTNKIFTIWYPSESKDGFKMINLKDYINLIHDAFCFWCEFSEETKTLKVDGKIAIKPAQQESWFSPEEVERRNAVRKGYAEKIVRLVNSLKSN